jgi:hypothetical protein
MDRLQAEIRAQGMTSLLGSIMPQAQQKWN